MKNRKSTTSSQQAAPKRSSARAKKPMVLEPRVLLDAAALMTVGEMADADQFVATAPGAELESAQQQELETALRETEALAAQSNTDRRELVIIDSAVPDKEVLLNALNDNVQVIELDADRDAVAQITTALSGASDFDAIHIVSHGNTEKFISETLL